MKHPVKITYRIDALVTERMELERLRRIRAGVPRRRCTLTALVNEALARAYGQRRR